MVPSQADIARYRHVAAACVRGVGVVILLYAAARLGGHVYQHFDRFVSGFRGTTQQQWLYIQAIMPATLFVGSLVFVLFPKQVARWLVPASPTVRCPTCRFRLEGLASDICPECGVGLGPEFRPRATPKPERSDPQRPSEGGVFDGGSGRDAG
ncbi:MAG: hypothetical protein AAGB48_07025 [Planctomycetota bacterium]